MLSVYSNLFALGPWAELSRPEPAPTSVAGTPGDPCVFIPTDPCIDASLLSADVAALNPQLHPLEELRFFGESKLPFAGPVTKTPPPPLMAGHCYAVRNVYTDSNGKQWVQLYNPWGVGHPPPISFEDLERLRFVTA